MAAITSLTEDQVKAIPVIEGRIKSQLVEIFLKEVNTDGYLSRFCSHASLPFELLPDEKRKIERCIKECSYYDAYDTFFTSFITHSPKDQRNVGVIVNTLNDMQWLSAKDKILETNWTKYIPTVISIVADGFWFGLRETVASFAGRTKELDNLHKQLLNAQQMEVGQRYVIVSGMSGIGKSSLCRRYSYKYNEHYGKHAIWINAETEQTLTDSFKELVLELEIKTEVNGKKKDLKTLAKDVYTKFDKNVVLIIFDNAEEYNCVQQCFPESIRPDAKKPAILITSKWKELIEPPDGIIIKLEGLLEDDGISFIRANIGYSETMLDHPETQEQMRALYKAVEGHPLALQQSVGYIRKTHGACLKKDGYTIREYLHGLQSMQDLKSIQNWVPQAVSKDYGKTTVATFELSFKKIRENVESGIHAVAALRVAACLNPEGIDVTILHDIVRSILPEAERDDEMIDGGIILASEYSLYELIRDEGQIKIHRLVQLILLKYHDNGTQEKVLEYFTNVKDFDTVTQSVVSHAVAAWVQVKKDDLLIKNLCLARNIMNAFMVNRRWMEARGFCSALIGTVGRLEKLAENGPNNKDILDTKYVLATCLQKTVGNYPVACQLFKEIQDRYESIQSPIEDIMNAKYGYAVSLHNMGQFQEAYTKHTEVYEIQKEILKEEDPFFLKNYQKIAVSGDFFGTLNKYQEGEAIYRKVYEIRKRNLPENHPDILQSKHNIACSLHYQKKDEEAVALYQEVYENQKIVLGEEHPDTINNLHMFSISLDALGRYEEAVVLFQKVFALRVEILGEEHPDTLMCKFNMAHCLLKMEKYTEALTANQEVYDVRKRVLGEDHFHTKRVKYNLDVCKNKIESNVNMEPLFL